MSKSYLKNSVNYFLTLYSWSFNQYISSIILILILLHFLWVNRFIFTDTCRNVQLGNSLPELFKYEGICTVYIFRIHDCRFYVGQDHVRMFVPSPISSRQASKTNLLISAKSSICDFNHSLSLSHHLILRSLSMISSENL